MKFIKNSEIGSAIFKRHFDGHLHIHYIVQVEELIVPKEPTKKKTPANPRGEALAMTEDQFTSFLGRSAVVLKPIFRILFIVMYVTATRVSEACSLKRCNIDMKKGRITIPDDVCPDRVNVDTSIIFHTKQYTEFEIFY